MSVTPSRRAIVMGLGSLSLLNLPALAANEPFAGDVMVGDASAPLTVYEYISYTCPACANFHQTVWPQVKEAYVDTGKVKFIVRGFYRNTTDLDAGVVARCGGERGFYPMADVFLSTQSTWMRAPDVGFALRQIAKRAGLPGAKVDACLADMDFKTKLVEAFRLNVEEHGIRATPSFVINGTTHSGGMPFDEFSELLDNALS